MKVEPDWDRAELSLAKETQAVFEHQNSTYETCDAPWEPTFPMEVAVSHNFSLTSRQNFSGYSPHLILVRIDNINQAFIITRIF